MPNYNRVSLKEVRQAYKETKTKPCKGTYFKGDGKRCCALGVLALQRGITTAGDVVQWAAKKYGSRYEDGFTCGFDYGNKAKITKIAPFSSKYPRFVEGFKDGKRIAKALGVCK